MPSTPCLPRLILGSFNLQDTFLDAQHVRDSFPGHTVQFVDPRGQPDEAPKRPFRVTFPAAPQPHSEGQKGVKRKRGEAAEADEAAGTEAAPAAATSSKAGAQQFAYPSWQSGYMKSLHRTGTSHVKGLHSSGYGTASRKVETPCHVQ